MRVLILSANTGEGHNSAARAIKEVFDRYGDDCVIEDGLRFLSDRWTHFLSWGHVFLYRNIPWFFNGGYRFLEAHNTLFRAGSPMYKIVTGGVDPLYDCIVQGGYDTVITTHPLTALLLTQTQRRHPLPIRTAFVATDYTCSPCVKDSDLDLYFIPDETLTEDFLCPSITHDKIIPSGIPIRQMFYSHTDKTSAKAAYGIPSDQRHIVMMSGSMGCGPIDRLTDLLTKQLPNDATVSVVCGTNEKLKTELLKKYGTRKNLRVLGFVTDMSGLLDSADLCLTKAGGISTSEAAVKRIPMAFISSIAGCEEYNRDFYVRRGCAYAGDEPEAITKLCCSLLRQENRRAKMREAFCRQSVGNAAEEIYAGLCQRERRTIPENNTNYG